MGKAIDETGKTYGYLTVISRVENDKRRRAQWLCQCKCGNTQIASGVELRNGHVKSCGCYQKEQTSKAGLSNLVGQTIGNFYIIEPIRGAKGGPRNKWRCKCNLCGNDQVFISTSNLQQQYSCGCQYESKGTRKIKEILEANNIDFIQEKTYDDLRFNDTNKMARFDFYLPKYNTIIEYDGRQHYLMGKAVYDNEMKFTKTQEHDQQKNQYAKDNHIILIRIPYTHFNAIILEDLLPNTSKFVI